MVQNKFEGCPLGLNERVNPKYGPNDRVQVDVGSKDSGYAVFATEKFDKPFPEGTPRCFLQESRGKSLAAGSCNECLRRIVKKPYPSSLA